MIRRLTFVLSAVMSVAVVGFCIDGRIPLSAADPECCYIDGFSGATPLFLSAAASAASDSQWTWRMPEGDSNAFSYEFHFYTIKKDHSDEVDRFLKSRQGSTLTVTEPDWQNQKVIGTFRGRYGNLFDMYEEVVETDLDTPGDAERVKGLQGPVGYAH